MTFAPRALTCLALTVVVASSALGCAFEDEEEDVEESSEAITDGRIVVRQFGSPGPTIATWGYDLKQDGRSRAMKPALAKELFQDIGLNLIRVAIRAKDGHPARGVENVKGAVYADDLDAIAIAKAARPDLPVFASLKLLGDDTFPGWVKDGGAIEAGKYAALLENYLGFMKSKGVTVDHLGVDNERKFNHGGITPAKYNQIVADVTGWCKNNGVKVPQFIAAEDYGPEEDIGWLQDLAKTNAGFERVDKVGVHIYSKHRNAAYVAAMDRLAKNTHGKRLWDSELHWNDLDEDGTTKWDDIEKGMLTLFDHFDLGFQSMTWWAFQPRSKGQKSSFVMSELVHTTVGAATLPTAARNVQARGFKTGAKEVTLWVANLDGKAEKDQLSEVANHEIASASYLQWTSNGGMEGRTGNAKLAKKDTCFKMDYPANSITRVTVTLK